MIAGTIVARNYLPQAKVLSDSFLHHHPDALFHILVIDGDIADKSACDGANVVLPNELGMEPGEWEQMAGIYTVMEFATSLKPAFLSYLLRHEDAGPRPPVPGALYLDPDIVVYHPFPEVFRAADESGIALTPHVLHPLPRDGRDPTEADLMHSGLFNLGFICVSTAGDPFLEWWRDRVRHDAVVDLPHALFTDQRWVDWVPSIFPVSILRDHGLNVAYWNLHERPLDRNPNGTILARGDALKFFHYSGYEPERPWLLSKHAAHNPRVRLVENPLLIDLCEDYSRRLHQARRDAPTGAGYGLEQAANGLRLTPLVRSAYRRSLRTSLVRAEEPPPSPFDSDAGDAFARWIMAPNVGLRRLGIGPWHHELWQSRADLRIAFPDLEGADGPHYRSWFDNGPEGHGLIAQLHLPGGLLPADHPDADGYSSPAPIARARFGWNVIGYLSSELGVGDAGRLVNQAAEAAGVSTHLVAVTAPFSRARHRSLRLLGEDLRYRNSIYCLNADQLERTMNPLSDGHPRAGSCEGRRIGLWFWEVDVFPNEYVSAARHLDEIWAASHFSAEIISKACQRPVEVVPLPICTPSRPTPLARRHLGLPPGFLFLFSYDFNSGFHRKNPLGLIDAYRKAFSPGEGKRLVLKSINGHLHQAELDLVRYEVRDRDDIVVIDGYIDSVEVEAMIELSDCFVSLHRAEGFGLHLAMAMAHGRPVIATGYSGNLTFMDDACAFLVPSSLIRVGPGSPPYPEVAQWADPHIDSAVDLMRTVASDGPEVQLVAAAGRSRIMNEFSLQRAADEIGGRLRSGWPGPGRIAEEPNGYRAPGVGAIR